MNEIVQDSESMSRIADELEQDATQFGNIIEEMYALIDNKLGAEDDGQKAWFGPKATVFQQNINNKKVDFENAKKNISTIAQNLQSHADAWNSFENA